MDHNNNKLIIKKLGAMVVFVCCFAGLILNTALHLHFSGNGETALILGVVLGAFELL